MAKGGTPAKSTTQAKRGPAGRGGKNTRRTGSAVGARRGPSTSVIVGVLVVLLFAGAVGFGLYRAQQKTGAVPPNATDTGVVVGQAAAPRTIDVYLDFQCPVCREYEKEVGATVDGLIASGAAKVVYHPLGFLDRYSTTGYSSRAAAASGCAAQAGVFPAFFKLLYANQPPENSAGLPDQQLIALGQQAGAGGDFGTCVTDKTYAGWVKGVTDAASRAGVNATPTVQVDGKQIENTVDALRQAVPSAR